MFESADPILARKRKKAEDIDKVVFPERNGQPIGAASIATFDSQGLKTQKKSIKPLNISLKITGQEEQSKFREIRSYLEEETGAEVSRARVFDVLLRAVETNPVLITAFEQVCEADMRGKHLIKGGNKK